ncbi:MAG: hypothetical protein UU09_C0040G0011 [Microgenomates group bacterium GW2011_GWA2_40_6]|nr:MAG: hypothetical protein UU09_C0040G0011 [Microgenomates group bacterium GW2011_GWA2_40_6]
MVDFGTKPAERGLLLIKEGQRSNFADALGDFEESTAKEHCTLTPGQGAAIRGRIEGSIRGVLVVEPPILMAFEES